MKKKQEEPAELKTMVKYLVVKKCRAKLQGSRFHINFKRNETGFCNPSDPILKDKKHFKVLMKLEINLKDEQGNDIDAANLRRTEPKEGPRFTSRDKKATAAAKGLMETGGGIYATKEEVLKSLG